MSKTLTLILGGARGGKSSYAEMLANGLGERVIYAATAQAGDDEMQRRIQAHRTSRPATWTTVEAAIGVGRAAAAADEFPTADAVLLDCLTLLVSNVILDELPGDDPDSVDETTARARIALEVDELLAAYEAGPASWIVVSNEVGWGVVPPYPLGRVYRDLLGWANQRVAAVADHVILMVAGLPIDVKALSSAAPGV